MTRAVPTLAETRRPTQGERDTLWREESLRRAILREHGRPVPIALGGVSLPLPLFGLGPSRAQRTRDSIVHRENLLRMARIAARARATRDTSRTVAAHGDTTKTHAP